MAARPIRAIEDVESQFYLQMEVADRPGVLHAITGPDDADTASVPAHLDFDASVIKAITKAIDDAEKYTGFAWGIGIGVPDPQIDPDGVPLHLVTPR